MSKPSIHKWDWLSFAHPYGSISNSSCTGSNCSHKKPHYHIPAPKTNTQKYTVQACSFTWPPRSQVDPPEVKNAVEGQSIQKPRNVKSRRRWVSSSSLVCFDDFRPASQPWILTDGMGTGLGLELEGEDGTEILHCHMGLINFPARQVPFVSSGFYFDSASLLAANVTSSYSFQRVDGIPHGSEKASASESKWLTCLPVLDYKRELVLAGKTEREPSRRRRKEASENPLL
ncbi:hypothetical protein P7K49_011521 [Saguinus oedipus]|uniref:Uncharacterized protein n=1 Tax=Saguinus oedipus TaxID=9490 RepID=A0ABQ9VRH5_SAGOE|nr:hypothetical protein P7K49_011521 [Saguinus oedipus]